MFPYPSGQMSHCFTNISVICIMQTFEFRIISSEMHCEVNHTVLV